MNNTQVEQLRLNDFTAILRYHLTAKINHYIKSGKIKSPRDFYAATAAWKKWRNREIGYNPGTYANISIVNACALTRHQVQHIIGKYPKTQEWINYADLIGGDGDITIRHHGTMTTKDQRHAFAHTYFLPEDDITGIFADSKLKERILDITSDLYTPRQRRLIFNQLIIGTEYQTPPPS